MDKEIADESTPLLLRDESPDDESPETAPSEPTTPQRRLWATPDHAEAIATADSYVRKGTLNIGRRWYIFFLILLVTVTGSASQFSFLAIVSQSTHYEAKKSNETEEMLRCDYIVLAFALVLPYLVIFIRRLLHDMFGFPEGNPPDASPFGNRKSVVEWWHRILDWVFATFEVVAFAFFGFVVSRVTASATLLMLMEAPVIVPALFEACTAAFEACCGAKPDEEQDEGEGEELPAGGDDESPPKCNPFHWVQTFLCLLQVGLMAWLFKDGISSLDIDRKYMHYKFWFVPKMTTRVLCILCFVMLILSWIWAKYRSQEARGRFYHNGGGKLLNLYKVLLLLATGLYIAVSYEKWSLAEIGESLLHFKSEISLTLVTIHCLSFIAAYPLTYMLVTAKVHCGIALILPTSLTFLLVLMSSDKGRYLVTCSFIESNPYLFYLCLAVIFLAQVCFLVHRFSKAKEFHYLASEKDMFTRMNYSGVFWKTSCLLTLRDHSEVTKKKGMMTYIIGALYRETQEEMKFFIDSMRDFQVDAFNPNALDARGNPRKNIESHLWFDKPFVAKEKFGRLVFNKFALRLLSLIDHEEKDFRETEYGILLESRFPVSEKLKSSSFKPEEHGIKLFIHFKDPTLVQAGKRESQILGLSVVHQRALHSDFAKDDDWADWVYALLLDGDMIFRYHDVLRMKDYFEAESCVADSAGRPTIAGACGRIIPKGRGLWTSFQKFSYSCAHWMSKSPEDVFGTVSCLPGAFSMFRLAPALEAFDKYCIDAESGEEFLKLNMGEDRFLTTCMLEAGKRTVYCALSSASTYCPQTFAEYISQQRRWISSSLANDAEILHRMGELPRRNRPFFSGLFMLFKNVAFFFSYLGPGMTLLFLSGGTSYAFGSGYHLLSIVVAFVLPAILLLYLQYGKQSNHVWMCGFLSCVFCCFVLACYLGLGLHVYSNATQMCCNSTMVAHWVDDVDGKDSLSPLDSNFNDNMLFETYESFIFHTNGTNHNTTHSRNTTALQQALCMGYHVFRNPNVIYLEIWAGLLFLCALLNGELGEFFPQFFLNMLLLPVVQFVIPMYALFRMTDRSWGTREQTLGDVDRSRPEDCPKFPENPRPADGTMSTLMTTLKDGMHTFRGCKEDVPFKNSARLFHVQQKKADKNAREVGRYKLPSSPVISAFYANADIVVVCFANKLVVYDAQLSNELYTENSPPGCVFDCCVPCPATSDKKQFAVGYSTINCDSVEVALLQSTFPSEGEKKLDPLELGELVNGVSKVKALSFSPCGMRLAISCISKEDGASIIIVDLDTKFCSKLDLSQAVEISKMHKLSKELEVAVEGVGDSPDLLQIHQRCRDAALEDLDRMIVCAVSFTSDGASLISCTDHGHLFLWDAQSGQFVGMMHDLTEELGDTACCVEFSKDGLKVALGNLEGVVRVFDVSSGKLITTIRTGSMRVQSLSFEPKNDRYLAVGTESRNVFVCSTKTGRVLETIVGHSSSVTSLCYSPSGKQIVSGAVGGCAITFRAEVYVPDLERPSEARAIDTSNMSAWQSFWHFFRTLPARMTLINEEGTAVRKLKREIAGMEAQLELLLKLDADNAAPIRKLEGEMREHKVSLDLIKLKHYWFVRYFIVNFALVASIGAVSMHTEAKMVYDTNVVGYVMLMIFDSLMIVNFLGFLLHYVRTLRHKWGVAEEYSGRRGDYANESVCVRFLLGLQNMFRCCMCCFLPPQDPTADQELLQEAPRETSPPGEPSGEVPPELVAVQVKKTESDEKQADEGEIGGGEGGEIKSDPMRKDEASEEEEKEVSV